jgi:1-acyl-sn-glycerol-3-phosphate acyltransferase
MSTVLPAIRSLLFYLLFYVQTAILAIIVGLIAMIARRRTPLGWALALYWIHSHLVALRLIAGIRTDIGGEENIPDGPCIIASKHMSDWDIFALLPAARRPAFVAKKELMDIPFFGHAAMSFDTIRLDRSLGGDAIPRMIEEARAALARGARIIIFPEGTRKAPLADHDYRYGIVRLYEGLGVPVVPVGVNSGLFWGRRSLLLWPGTARARFLPAIPAGLPSEVFRARLIEAIEGETNRLILSAYEAGLHRPVPQPLHDRLEALRRGEVPGPAPTTRD